MEILRNILVLLQGDPDLAFSKDEYGASPLHWAAETGQRDVVEFLPANKAEVNAKDDKGETPFHWAALMGHKDVAELLRQHGGHE